MLTIKQVHPYRMRFILFVRVLVLVFFCQHKTASGSLSGGFSISLSSPQTNGFHIPCNGQSTGSVDLIVTGGTPPFNFNWSNGASVEDITGISAGTYTVTVTDANMAFQTQSITLIQPALLQVSITPVNATCMSNNGSATAVANGGAGGTGYLWNTGSNNASINSLSAGVYTVTVTDINGCTASNNAAINNTVGPSLNNVSISNVNCFGGNNGSINVNFSGGGSNTYLWNDGVTSEDRVNIPAGTYTVTATDNNSCSTIESFNVTQPTAVSVTASTTAGCGVVTATAGASGGSGGFSYLWSNGAAGSVNPNLSNGTYTVTATDNQGCSASTSVSVLNSGFPVGQIDSTVNPSCAGINDADIYISVSGGIPPYSYLWSNGSIVQDQINIAAGNYSVIITDSIGCTDTLFATLTAPAPISIGFSITDPTCNLVNGSITAIPSGGTSPYQYAWSNGSSSQSINGLNAGVYTVTVTDANNCQNSNNVTLTQHPPPVIGLDSLNHVSCFGLSTGDIYITVTQGTTPFNYQWSNGATSQDLVNVAAGTYTVTVTDAFNCTATTFYTITQPTQITGNFINLTPATCNQANGSVTVSASGGSPPYTYLWSNGQTTATATNLAAANYTVTITDSQLCSMSFSTNIPATGSPNATINNLVNVTCNGLSNGSIDINVTGGVSPYDFQWSPGGQTTEDISGLPQGTYTVTVTDDIGCSSTSSFVVTEPLPLTATFDIYNSTCSSANGAAAVNVSGGTQPYNYQWNTGAASDSVGGVPAGTYTVTVTDNNSCNAVFSDVIGDVPGPTIAVDSVVAPLCSGGTGSIYITVTSGQQPYTYEWSDGSSAQDATGLLPGNYTVTVTDAALCTSTQSLIIPVTDPVDFSIVPTNATCSQANGSAEVTNITGGTPPYSYQWSNGDNTATASNLQPGNIYTVTVNDANNCSSSDTVSVGNNGGPIINLGLISHVSCYGEATGSILIAPVGIPPLTIQWSNGDNSLLADSLTAGTYTVTVTDLFNCPNTAQFTVNQNDSISVNFNVNPESCNLSNGSITATASGGAGLYTYVWSNGALGPTASSLTSNIYTVTVTDLAFCSVVRSVNVPGSPAMNIILDIQNDVTCSGASNGSISITATGGVQPLTYLWSGGQTTDDISGIPGGIYTVTVTDSTGCNTTFSTTVTEPDPINIQYNAVNASCNNSAGSITTSVSGGIGGYTYQWSTGDVTPDLFNIPGGTYTLTVTDANTCQAFVAINVGNDDGPIVTLASHQMVSCSGNADGAININVISGNPPYTFLWSTGDTTQNISGLPVGIYNVTVRDADNCIGTFTDTISQPGQLGATATILNPTCFQLNGTIAVTPTGGTNPFGFVWSTGALTSTISQLDQGVYTVTITDAMNCTFDTSFTLTNSGAPVITLVNLVNASCFGSTDGSIDIDVSGGVPPYSYLWQGILVTTQDLQNLGAGTYNISVTDSTGCASNAQYIITENAEIDITFPVIENASCGQANGSILVQVTGGTAPYTYQWSNGSTSDNLLGLSAGSYTVTVTDAAGCSAVDIANISNSSGPQIVSVDSTLVTCPGDSNGTITVVVQGGTPPLNYSWTNISANTPVVTNLPANTYTLTVTDADNCTVIRSVTITEPARMNISAVLSQHNPPYNLSCYQSSNGSIDVTVSGGVPPYLYIWSTGSNNQDISNLTAGSYTLIVRDTNGCEEADTFLLTQPPQITAFAGTDRTICGVDSLQLNATPIGASLIGQWSLASGDTSVSFANASAPNTFVSHLPLGANTLLWSVSQLNGSCTVSDSIIVVVTNEVNASAGIDKTNLCGSIYTMSAQAVQSATSSYWTLLSGSGIIIDSALNTTLVAGLSTGPNYFIWTVRNGNCIDSDTVLINVLTPAECLSPIEIPNAYSPNGDGHNDFFEVRGIDDYPDNTFTVFDRWGIEVYSKSGYLNEWSGENNNNEPLPDGTYFYTLRVSGFNEVFNGFIDLRR